MTDEPQSVRDEKTGQFVPGHTGMGGRPKGSRNKLGEAFLSDMLADWEKHGPTAIEKVRTEKPDQYLKVVASILPRDLNVNINPLEEATDAELIQQLRDLQAVIGPFLGAPESGEDSGRTGSKKAH